MNILLFHEISASADDCVLPYLQVRHPALESPWYTHLSYGCDLIPDMKSVLIQIKLYSIVIKVTQVMMSKSR